MYTFLICICIAAAISLFFLTETDRHPTTIGGWVRASILSLPLTFLGWLVAFVLWLGFFWLLRNEPFDLRLFFQEPWFVQHYVLFSSLIGGAVPVGIFVESVARHRAKRRRNRK